MAGARGRGSSAARAPVLSAAFRRAALGKVPRRAGWMGPDRRVPRVPRLRKRGTLLVFAVESGTLAEPDAGGDMVPLSEDWIMQRAVPGAQGVRACPIASPERISGQRCRFAAACLREMDETMSRRRNQGADAPTPDGESAGRADDRTAAPRRGPRQPRPYPDPVDDALDDSFPASDPPSWAGR
jgi:hypothetical protein